MTREEVKMASQWINQAKSLELRIKGVEKVRTLGENNIMLLGQDRIGCLLENDDDLYNTVYDAILEELNSRLLDLNAKVEGL